MRILIQNGRVLDPASGRNGSFDILTEDDKIIKVEEKIDAEKAGAGKVIDAGGCFVMPGLIDLHVHLRDPGLTHKETVETGAMAAARGGFTTIVAMPNTKPVTDDKQKVSYVHNKAKMNAPIHVLQAGAVTKGQEGKELADIEGMAEAGAPAISEDGKSVMDSGLYREAMKIAARAGIPVLAHCEDINLVKGGVVNADEHTEAMGYRGISNAVEDIIAARDIMLARETGVHLHLCHCSTKDSVRMVKEAKEEGLFVTAEVCPHHFTLTSEDIVEGDTNFKMNPPLRTKEDVEALRQGLKDDIMDVISTDHAPHAASEKLKGMDAAPFGIVGLETAVPLTVTELVEKGILTPMQMAEKMSYNPAKVIGVDRGSLEAGKEADIVIINPKEEYIIDASCFASKGRNTPFNGWKVRGKVKMTICGGRIVYDDSKK
ncbi:dihydroorotase [Murimonas intestini]|uniref:Dihydroorotase n=1 Tax=Murimonas intestini TaxID=1337051 RepID=A0AB73SZB7_9FIRM|nr:dihydroorotase [Murimonas intestini]MCR1842863.1 dihydroorotase [Murimonas intestini]MCR1868172.1 dihydroorotase [Murimonas intestini]MCR1885336.1 dihydroorotase [Murimonas intestini]